MLLLRVALLQQALLVLLQLLAHRQLLQLQVLLQLLAHRQLLQLRSLLCRICFADM